MDRNHSCKIHGYFSSTVIKGDVPCPWCERDSYRKIVCPDNPGGRHRWNGDGQCLDCCNYATDLIDSTLPTKGSEESDEPVWSLTCCGSESGVHLIGCQSEDALAGRIHRPPEKHSGS